LWTQRRKAKVAFVHKDDGRFWIAWEDFILHFCEVYVCRFFDAQRWPFRAEIRGAWSVKEGTAGGCMM
jgi:hypothetical protein